MSRFNHKIPQNLTIEDSVCYPLNLPNDPEYINLVIRALRLLTLDRHYERDENKSALDVRRIFNDITYTPFIDSLESDTRCGSANNDCFRVRPQNRCIEFFPNDPFNYSDDEGDYTSLGIWSSWDNEVQKFPKWVNDLLNTFVGADIDDLGYGLGDAFVTSPNGDEYGNTLQQLIDFVRDILAFNYPKFTVELRGTGTVEITMLSVPSGGAFVGILDGGFNIVDVLEAIRDNDILSLSGVKIQELSRDIVQIPPDTTATTTIPFDLGGDSTTLHTLECFVIPRFNDEFLSPIGLGGGLRHVEVCGNLTVLCADGTEITPNNSLNDILIRSNILIKETEDVCQDIDPCIDNNSTVVANQQTSQSNSDAIEDQKQNSPTNEYSDPPTINDDPDRLCQSTDYVSKQLRTDIITIVDGNLFNTLIDGIQYFMSIGGFNFASLSALITLLLANNNPNIEQEILDARPEVHEILYCCELDFGCAIADINASGEISSDAKSAYVGMINAWTASRKSLIAGIGDANSGADCSDFCYPSDWYYKFDFNNMPTNGSASIASGTLYNNYIRTGDPVSGGTGQIFAGIILNNFNGNIPIVRCRATAYANSLGSTAGAFLRFISTSESTPYVNESYGAPYIGDMFIDGENQPNGWTFDFARIEARAQRPASQPSAYVELQSVELWGLGQNPFI